MGVDLMRIFIWLMVFMRVQTDKIFIY